MPAVVYKQLTGDTGLKNLSPVQCTMRVYTTQAITNLHICLDPTPLNKAVIREHYHYQSPDDIYHHLCNAKYLTVIDFKKCYWQCLLDEESSYLTTFNTPYGRFRFVRLPLVLMCLVMQCRGKLMRYTIHYQMS